MNTHYRVQEFAKVAGVTVRALHHYDRLGLLKPLRTDAGYRLYRPADLGRLEQIVALKFLGLPLRQVKVLLETQPRELPDALRAQLRALEDKRRHLDLAIAAIRDAERAMVPGRVTDTAVLRRIIEVIEMESHSDFTKKYYSEEASATLAERRANWTPEQQKAAEEGSRAWMDLFRDVEAAIDLDPAGDQAQALAHRWRTLVENFTGGDKGIESGLKKVWADRQNWPAGLQQQAAPFANQKVWDFIAKACASRKP